MHLKDIKRTIREYFEQLYANEFGKVDEIEEAVERDNLSTMCPFKL